MNKTCEWRQLQCIVLWDSRNLLFFSFKATLWHKSLPEAAPLPHSPPCQTVRCRNDRQAGTRSWRVSGAAMGKIRYQWRNAFSWKNPPKNVGKFFPDFFHVCSWAGELSKLFQSGLPLSRVPSLQPYFDIVKKMRNFFPIVILFLSILYVEQFVK